jgi:hypothetical protein
MEFKKGQLALSEVASHPQQDHRPTRMTLRQYLDTQLRQMTRACLLSLALTIALSAGLPVPSLQPAPRRRVQRVAEPMIHKPFGFERNS